ncbi:radical SAM domain-containing protein [Salpingoeca rosetta]|uniref:Radical SAM domain-containing protein n=1 Tax=Salpingoeca rosetta (strain ATCC 50818 / BSB-021) TaxID=946362 RepID=F2US34_SALR5|nr:radical SAM domain-containing protein [Salpingoeca rosetta]EGD80439.1 radical SAM domain-containing protein [Salpingoeca rosetta]|eukprot:XP_004988003.1 radical SAM domain-containing protein [Salpingoeca rosetta]
MAPSMKRRLHPMPLLDEGLVLEECTKLGINHKHAYKMWRHIIARGVTDVEEIPELPKALYKLVKEKFVITTSKLESFKTSADESTTKLLIRLQDGALVETVIMRYGRVELRNFPSDRQRRTEDGETVFASKERATVCVSSQVGCKMGCTFCATGTMGLLSNLTAGEILEQLYHANTVEKIRNVVFMGMGEPLDNYDAVVMAVRGMTDVQRFSLSPSRIAVSTVGVVPKMLKMAEDIPQVGLALSLHAPTQELRAQIVPTAKAWHIDRIMAAMDNFIEHRSQVASRKSHVLIEYVLIDNVNSSEEVAHQLGRLLEGREVILNVIPYNPTDVPHDYKAPSSETLEKFNAVLREYDLRTIVRQELGQDVNAACGQLVISSQRNNGATAGTGGGACQPTDIEDMFQLGRSDNSNSGAGDASSATARGSSLRRRVGGQATDTQAKAQTTAEKVEAMRNRNDARSGVASQRLKTTIRTTDAQERLIAGLDNRVTYALIVFFVLAGIRLLFKLFLISQQHSKQQ